MHRVSTSTILCQPLIPANKWGFQKSWNTPPTRKHTHSKELLSDPHATGALVRCKERSPTAFLAPDGFVQPPWKPHTPRLHRRSASSSEEEQRTRQRALFAGDIFISPLCSGVRLTCSLFISSVLSLYPDMFYFTRSQTSSFSARSLIWCKETIPTKSGLNRLKLLCMQPSERRLIHPEMLKVKVVNASDCGPHLDQISVLKPKPESIKSNFLQLNIELGFMFHTHVILKMPSRKKWNF